MRVAAKAYTLLKSDLHRVYPTLDESGMPDVVTRLDEYLMQLSIIGLNSGNYDIIMIKPYLAQYFGNKAALVYVGEVNEVVADLKEAVDEAITFEDAVEEEEATQMAVTEAVEVEAETEAMLGTEAVEVEQVSPNQEAVRLQICR